MKKISEIDFGGFKAAMFDYDGTLTEKGNWGVSPEMAKRIGELLSAGFPMAVCTGRQVESFAKRFGPTLRWIRENFGAEAASNLYLIAENGAVGYEFKGEPGTEHLEEGWDEFYRADWPSEVPKDKFEAGLEELLGDKVDFLTHLVPVVMGPRGRMEMKVEDVYKASAEVYRIAREYMMSFEAVGGGNALDHLHIGDSGLGVLVCPADGDKDSGIRVFYDFLKDRGVEFSDDCSDGGCCEIMVVGDSPQKKGNDYYFLNDRYHNTYDRYDNLLLRQKGGIIT